MTKKMFGHNLTVSDYRYIVAHQYEAHQYDPEWAKKEAQKRCLGCYNCLFPDYMRKQVRYMRLVSSITHLPIEEVVEKYSKRYRLMYAHKNPNFK